MSGCQTRCAFTGEIPPKEDPESLLEDWVVVLSSFSNYTAELMMEKFFAGTNYTAPTSFWLAFHSTESTDSTPGTELTGGGYARREVNLQQVSDRIFENDALLVGPTATADWTTAVSVTLYDASTAGNMLAWGTISPGLTLEQNKAYTVAQGALTVELV